MSDLKLVASVGEITTHCLDPVTEQAIRSVINKLGVSRIFKDNIHINADHMAIVSSSDENHNPIMTNDRFTCTTSPILNPLNVKWPVANGGTFVGQGQSLNHIHNSSPVFQDLLCNTNLIEHIVPCSISMECSMIFKDRSVAYEASSRLYNTYRNGEMYFPIDLIYDYPLPREIYTVLYMIYKMRELNTVIKDDGKPYTFLEYLRDNSVNRISPVINRNVSRKDVELISQTSCYNCIALLEYDKDKPDAEKNNQSVNKYSVDFSLTLQFARVDLLYLTYPVVINNQLVPAEALPVDFANHNVDIEPIYPFIFFKEYSAMTKPVQIITLLQYPWYDTWKVPTYSGFKRAGYQEFFITVFTLDLDKETTDIDLAGDLGDNKGLNADTIATMKEQGIQTLYPYLTFNVAVFANDYLVEQSTLSLNDDLVLSVPNKSKDRVYHLVISATTAVFNDTLNAARVIKYDIETNKE